MPAPTTARKQPTDRKPPAKKTAPKDQCSFVVDGETYWSRPLYEVITPGWVLDNRRREEIDLYMTLLEDAFDGVDGWREAYKRLTWDESQQLVGELVEVMETSVGESSGSLT